MSRPACRRFFRPAVEALEARAVPSVCTVDRLTDLDDGKDGRGDLRYCVIESLFRADTITFEVEGVINLTRTLPSLTRSVSIEGPGADLLTVRRNTGGDYEIFTVAAAATVTISGLTITNGSVSAGIRNYGTLAVVDATVWRNATRGIYNEGTLTVTRCTISENASGIGNAGMLTVSASTISGNTGGGISHSGTRPLTITNTTISGNTATGEGGGIWIFIGAGGSSAITNSTISGNSALREGGGIFNHAPTGTLAISNSTISGNSAGTWGGGIYHRNGNLTVSHSTITGNTAPTNGGGIGNYVGGTMATRNSIIARNTAPLGPDVLGYLGSLGHNLIGNPQDMSGWVETDILHVNPRLGSLEDNGGPTRTHALLPGSPALDAGDPTDAPKFDQRGLPRIVADIIDIGAFEVQPGPATWFWLDAPAEVAVGVPFDLNLYALDDYGHLATGYEGIVTFSTTDKDSGVVLPADYTFTADDQGMHTFAGEIVLVTPGEHYLSAVDMESGAYGEAAVTVIPSGAPGPRGSDQRAATDGVVVADLTFIQPRRRVRSAWHESERQTNGPGERHLWGKGVGGATGGPDSQPA